MLNGGGVITGCYERLINLLGIPSERLINVTVPTKFKKIIIPEVSLQSGNYYTQEYINMYNKIRNSVKPANYKKVYFSRCRFPDALYKERGEKEIEKFFKKNGYKIIYPEQLSIDEQISIIKGCKHFAAVSGTLPHNLLFAEDHTHAIIINKTYIHNDFQDMINEIRKIKADYIDCHLSLLPVTLGYGPFILMVNDNLIRYAEKHSMKRPKKSNPNEYLHWYLKTWAEIHEKKLENKKMNDIDVEFLIKLMRYYTSK